MSTYSYARGRGSGAKRDDMGRYSRARTNRYSRTSGYSYGDKSDILRDMMNEAQTDEERRVIDKLMRRIDKE